MKLPVEPSWPEWLQEGNLENYEVYTMADHELNDMNFYLKKDPASTEDACICAKSPDR